VVKNNQQHGERTQKDGERIESIVRNHCDVSMRSEHRREFAVGD
jgi:hypothetical protein